MRAPATMIRPSPAPHAVPSPLDDTGLEQSLIGTLLLNPRLAEALPASFSADHYIHPPHALIHTTIIEKADPDGLAMTVVSEALRGVDGCDTAYIASLAAASSAPTPETVRQFAERVTDRYRRRQALAIADQLRADALKGDISAPAGPMIFRAIERLDRLGMAYAEKRPGMSLDEAMDTAIAEADAVAAGIAQPGLMTGMAAVDRMVMGMQPKDVIYVAARPRVGKSSLIVPWGVHAARQLRDMEAKTGEPAGGVFLCMLEMKNEAVARRLLARESGVPGSVLRRGEHESQVPLLLRAQKSMSGLPVWMEDATGQTVPMIRQKARSAARRFNGKLGMIVIDHLHIIRVEDKHLSGKNETWAIGSISNAMKELADEFNCPVLAASQLNRGPEERPLEDRRPTMRDLRGSGTIEQDADIIFGIHRPELYLSKTPPDRTSFRNGSEYEKAYGDWEAKHARWKNKAELIPIKIRDGDSSEIISLAWNPETTSFKEHYA